VGIAGSEPWPLGLPLGDAIMGAMAGLLTALSTAGIAPFVSLGEQWGVVMGEYRVPVPVPVPVPVSLCCWYRQLDPALKQSQSNKNST
jgi:hypothetical protein